MSSPKTPSGHVEWWDFDNRAKKVRKIAKPVAQGSKKTGNINCFVEKFIEK